ncbi:hypothetical protein Celal_3572 [Cellulophaga algicola DSM 14237]|uniref:Uncharacterized protein n=1 Tax=Cellulophaga algicola (strain DSM 14237 / IC166 / ACAM 630) TaxID=688270 RepID=E6X8H7_CELAD|nr:hypothetical protein Celal_3572 [Cellulophaga algicola DSM 14237]
MCYCNSNLIDSAYLELTIGDSILIHISIITSSVMYISKKSWRLR